MLFTCSVLSSSTRAFESPSTRRPRTITTTKSATMPRNATSSFVPTVARERLTARTSGSVARVSIWAELGGYLGEARAVTPLRRQNGSRGDQLRDQPPAVDAGDLLVRADNNGHRPVVGIDVVALEVERALVLIDGHLHLVGRCIGDPVVPQLERACLLEE